MAAERRWEEADEREPVAPAPHAPALPQLRQPTRPADVLALQATAGNRAMVELLGRSAATPADGGLLLRKPTPVKESAQLKTAARKLAPVAGAGVDKVLADLTFLVDNGISEASLVRAVTSVVSLAKKSGAGLYAALMKMPAADAEAYWTIAGLVESKHPDLTTAIRLVRAYRAKVWFDLAATASRDVGAGKLFFAALTPAEAEHVWGLVQAQGKLTPDARTQIGEVVAAIQSKAAKADIEATAKLLARATGIGVAELREELEASVSVGYKPAELKRLAPDVLRLAKLPWGAPLFEALVELSSHDVEVHSVLARALGDKHSRFARAADMVFWFRSGSWSIFAKRIEEDYSAAEMLLKVVPPTELEELWKGLEHAGLGERQRDRLRAQVGSAMRGAAQGDSGRAESERYRGREVGEKLEKRVKVVVSNSEHRRQDMVANIGRGVGHVDTTLSALITVAGRYKKARDRVEETIKRAEAAAKLDQEKMDALMGIAIGVGVGLGLGAAVPLAEGASRAASAALDAVGEVYEGKVADKISGNGSGVAAPKSGDYDRADPQLKQTEAYKRCGELYRELATLGPKIESVSAIGGVGGKLQADARELAAAGFHRDLVIPQLERMVGALEHADQAAKKTASEVADLVWVLDAEAKRAQREAKRDDQLRMEKQIWIHWLGSRTGDEAELAGEEPVKGVLKAHDIVDPNGKDSSIGWGVGDWHSDANSRTGAQKAAAYSQALSLAGHDGKLIEGRPRQLATSTPDPEHARSRYRTSHAGVVGKATVTGANQTYAVQVIGAAKPGDELIITGVVGREDRDLYPGGDDTGKLGIVLSARPKPKTARDAVGILSDDGEATHAI